MAHAIRTSLSRGALEPGTNRVEDFSTGLSDMVSAAPETQAFQYELLLESRRRPDLVPQIRVLYDEYVDATQRELSRMLPTGAGRALARLVFAALDGLVLQQLVLGERAATESALEELRSMLKLLHAHHGDTGPATDDAE